MTARVPVGARIDPVLRDAARAAAKQASTNYDRWVELALERAIKRADFDHALRCIRERSDPEHASKKGGSR